MTAEIVHFNSTGIKAKIWAIVKSEALGEVALKLLLYAAQKVLRLRKVIIFSVTHGHGACLEPEPRVMMA